MTANPPNDALLLLNAAQGGLCGRCSHARLVKSSRGSAFVRCIHPALPRYQGQPVLRCAYAATE